MEMRRYCNILSISYKDRVTNEKVRRTTKHYIGPHEDLLTTVKIRKPPKPSFPFRLPTPTVSLRHFSLASIYLGHQPIYLST